MVTVLSDLVLVLFWNWSRKDSVKMAPRTECLVVRRFVVVTVILIFTGSLDIGRWENWSSFCLSCID